MSEFTHSDIARQTSLKHQWRKDKACTICHSPFGVVGLIFIRRYFCKICYRGICSKCSAVEIDQKDPKNLELMCKMCCRTESETGQGDMQEYITDSDGELQELRNKIEEIDKKIQTKVKKCEKYNEELSIQEKIFEESQTEAKIEQARHDKIKLLEKSEELKQQLNKICEEISEKEGIYFESESNIVNERTALELDKKNEVAQYKQLIALQDKNIDLQQTLESFKIHKEVKNKSHQQIAREQNLRDVYDKLLEEEKFHYTENIKLIDEVNNIECEISDADYKLQRMHDDIALSPTKFDTETDVIKQFNHSLQEQQVLIKKLKEELEAFKAKREAVSNNTCKCVAF